MSLAEPSSSAAPIPAPPSPQGPGRDNHVIKLGDHVIFQMPSEQTRVYKLEAKTTINLGKFGQFSASKIVGHPYGLTYENNQGELSVMEPAVVKELEETQATNELIEDVQSVQPLTYQEIEALKKSGANASEIINLQITSHANYELKTEYSKEKYKKRKQAKFNKTFTTLQPNVPNLLEHHSQQQPARVLHLRLDTLAQMLAFANVQQGGRYIVVEDCGGLITGAMLERMGGKGRLLTIHDADSPPAHHVLNMMNLTPEELAPLRVLNWATADEAHTPLHPPTEASEKKFRSDKERRRLDKRKEMIDEVAATRVELFEGEWEALVCASQYDPLSIVNRLERYLTGSANCVIHSPYSQVLAEVSSKMRAQGGWLNLQITEGWLRRYQVLPGRTHPDMNVQGSGGFVLQGIKVYDDPTASSYIYGELQAKKKRKLNDGAAAAAAASGAAEGSGTATPAEALGEADTAHPEEEMDVDLPTGVADAEQLAGGEDGADELPQANDPAVLEQVNESAPDADAGANVVRTSGAELVSVGEPLQETTRHGDESNA